MIVLNRAEIETLIDPVATAPAIAQAYIATSNGEVILPPVGHMVFPDYDADCHIKYGHLRGADTFTIKVATGFPMNAQSGLPTGGGLVLVMSARDGRVEAMLHDEMILTDIRTGLGGAIATRALAREDARHILVLGTGPQAARQIQAHAALMPKGTRFTSWGRNAGAIGKTVAQFADHLDIRATSDLKQASAEADVIVTATGATVPLIQSDWITPGTHITAVGADAPGKQELETALTARADVLVSDLTAQCLDHGELSHAAAAGLIGAGDVTELGVVLADPTQGRASDAQITIADLTGIAAQDIAIADRVLHAWRARNPG